MIMNDDKDGDDNNTGKMTAQIEWEIQHFQKKIFAKNMCVSWLETLTRTLKLRDLKTGYRIIINLRDLKFSLWC
jgi:hypothetical protein